MSTIRPSEVSPITTAAFKSEKKTDKVTIAVLETLENLSVTNHTPLTNWDWVCLQPCRLAGCYLTVQIDPKTTIYITKSSALKAGFEKIELKTQNSFKDACRKTHKFITVYPSLFDPTINLSVKHTFIKNSETLSDGLQRLNKGSSLALHTADSPIHPIILHKQASSDIQIITPNIKPIAEGGFAAVYTSNEFAIRVLHPTNNKKDKEAALKEQQHAQDIIALLEQTDPNLEGIQEKEITRIVSVIDSRTGTSSSSANWNQASLSKLRLGDAYDNRVTDLNQKHLVASKITKGLATMHKANIIHGDLKLENILLEGSRTEQARNITGARIADFGGAVNLNGENWAETPIYTSSYNTKTDHDNRIALRRDPVKDAISKHEKEIDIFQMGLTLYTLYTNQMLPFSTITDRKGVVWIKEPNYPEINNALSQISLKEDSHKLTDSQRTMIACMLNTDPAKRPSAEEVAKAFAPPGT